MFFTVSLKKRIIFLLCVFLMGFFITSLIGTFIAYKGLSSAAAMRILAVVQDLLMFIMPAIATAMIVTRQPAELLGIMRKPSASMTIIGMCTLIVSMPAMNAIIWLNQHMPLPDNWVATLSGLEEAAEIMIYAIVGQHSVPNLLMAILIIGVLAGLSEELLFRGALQRLLSTGGVAPQAAVWAAAIVFGIMHLQFFGLIPRIMLGALFGYALLWGGSLWVPVLLHIFNNTLYLVGQFIWTDGNAPTDTIGAGGDWLIVALSVALTAVGVALMRKEGLKSLKMPT